MPAYRNISATDVEAVEGYDGTSVSRNAILFRLGCDVTKGVDEMVCSHRNLRGQFIEGGVLYLRQERLDDPWLRGGFASLDAKICATRDPSQRKVLREMSREGFATIEEGMQCK